MRIAIKNNNNYIHTVCRTTGAKISIEPYKFVVIDTDSEHEISYWCSLKPENLTKIGISVYTNESDIMRLEAGDTISDNRIISVIDGSVSPSNNTLIAEEPEIVVEDIGTVKELPENYYYSKEELLQMDKEDLINICNNFNIKYRKNSSVKTLVKLILESGAL